MKDLFSSHARAYAKYRPTYPPSLFQFLSKQVPQHEVAWDCATGNGQAALGLVPYFEHVEATDPSKPQLEAAEKNSKIHYRECSAERPCLANASVDLITVAQAYHWFEHAAFFQSVRRVARPHAVIAVWCYELCFVTEPVDAWIQNIYTDILGSYWEPERRHVEMGYKTLPFPFDEIASPQFQMEMNWKLADLSGYVETWSALQKYLKVTGRNPVEENRNELKKAWGQSEFQTCRFPLHLRVGRVLKTA